MAIVQVSRITHRKGLSENLPQLAGAEFGWVIDDRKLYIGNGTIADGAPAVGNTEILTQYSDILSIANTYTYKGAEAGYTVQTGLTSSNPIQRTLQNKLDDFASVRDFGAVGDGVTDDTDAINRALFQLFCREVNTQVRRRLFFPAGTYRVTDSINIPPYAMLSGEGGNSSIIKMDISSDSTFGSYVLRTADSKQATGVNIGASGATRPQYINIQDMGIHSDEVTDLVLIEDAKDVVFHNCTFTGPLAESDLTSAGDDIACVRFASTVSLITTHINFDHCEFSGCSYAVSTEDQVRGINFLNSRFHTLYQGFLLGTGALINGGPQGFKIVGNIFDKIAYEAIKIGAIELNLTANNVFFDCGNDFQGLGSPVANIISFADNNNVSSGDLFERDETDNLTFARINLNDKQVFALDNGSRIKFGTYQKEVGKTSSLSVTGSATNIFTISTSIAGAFVVTYKFKETGGGAMRFGKLTVVSQDSDDSTGSLAYTDDYSENAPSGLVLTVEQTGATTVAVKYTAVVAGTFNYSIDHLG
jgi:hypothetical protein